MKKNKLELKQTGSTSEPVKGISIGELKTKLSSVFPKKGFVVAYLDNRVLIGRWENGDFKFHDNQNIEEKFIQKIRIFNESQEFFSWRTKSGFDGRLRKDDDQGKGTFLVVAEQVLVGTKAKNKADGFAEISEEKRGAQLMVPLANIEVDDKEKRLFIKTHNYIGYNPAGQATYTDCRFVAFTDGNMDLR